MNMLLDTKDGMSPENPEHAEWARSLDSCVMLVEIMRTASGLSPVLISICYVLSSAAANPTARRNFGVAGVCQVLTDFLRFPIANQSLCERLCEAVANLSIDCPDNVRLFVTLGAPQLVVEIMKNQGATKGVYWATAFAIRSLAGEIHVNDALGHLNCCETLLDIMKKYTGKSSKVVAMVCWALRKLTVCALPSEKGPIWTDNLLRLLHAQGCTRVVLALRAQHEHPDVCMSALWVIRILSLVAEGRAELCQKGACELILGSITEHIHLATVCLQAVHSLVNFVCSRDAASGGLSAECSHRLLVSNGAAVVSSVIRKYVDHPEIVECSCLVLCAVVRNQRETCGDGEELVDEKAVVEAISECVVKYSSPPAKTDTSTKGKSRRSSASHKVKGGGRGGEDETDTGSVNGRISEQGLRALRQLMALTES